MSYHTVWSTTRLRLFRSSHRDSGIMEPANNCKKSVDAPLWSQYAHSIGTKIDDLGWPWTATSYNFLTTFCKCWKSVKWYDGFTQKLVTVIQIHPGLFMHATRCSLHLSQSNFLFKSNNVNKDICRVLLSAYSWATKT